MEQYEEHLYKLEERVRALREDVRKLTSIIQEVKRRIGNSILHESEGRSITLRLHLLERDIDAFRANRRKRDDDYKVDPESKPLKKGKKCCCWVTKKRKLNFATSDPFSYRKR